MKRKFKDGNITLKITLKPVQSVEIYNKKDLLFGTDSPSTLLSISKVIADFAKELNEESKE
jgi:hypothetical protein